jgi:hypothetical protein
MKTFVEATVVQKFNQGTTKGTGRYRSFLELSLVTFFFSRKRKVTNQLIKRLKNGVASSNNASLKTSKLQSSEVTRR